MKISERKLRKHERQPLGNPWKHFTEMMKRPFLTERDKSVLLAIYKHRCLTSGQIAEVFFKFDRYGGLNRASDVLARRRLRLMYQQHLIDRFFVDVGEGNGSSQQHVMLDTIGSYVIAGLMNCKVEELKWRKEYNEVRLPYLQHTVDINDFYVQLIKAARRNKEHEVGEFLVENLARQQYEYQRKTHTFTPDAYGQYFSGDSGVHFFLEIDRGTMTVQAFAEKVARYAYYYVSDAYRALYDTFPLILVVTTNWERAAQLKKAVEREDGTDLQWYFTTKEMTEKDILQDIWLFAGSNEPVAFWQ